MPELITSPELIPVPGGKQINEYVGRVRTGDSAASVAHMIAPAGNVIDVRAGQAVVTRAGETVRYSVPSADEAGSETTEYVAVCVPAFAPDLAHRAAD